MTPTELTIVIIVGIIVFGLTAERMINAFEKIKLAKLGYQTNRDGHVVKL